MSANYANEHEMNVPGCNPEVFVGWNGRECFENVMVQIATRDDEDCEADGSIEVMRLAVTPKNEPIIDPPWTSGTDSEDESTLQHVVTEKRDVMEAATDVAILQNRVDCAKAEMRSLDEMSVKEKRLNAQAALSDEQYEDMDSLRDGYNSLREKSNNLTRELVESTKTFEKTITSYDFVIAMMKGLLSETKEENATLKRDLEKARSDSVASLEKINAHSLAIQTAYRESVDMPKKRLEEERAIEADKKITELTAEVQELQNKLDGAMLSNNESMQCYEQLRVECTSLRADKDVVDAKNVQLTTQVLELQDKMDGAMLSNSESMVIYEKLRVDCTNLRADKDEVDAKNDELTEEVRELQDKLDGAVLSYNETMQLYEQLRIDSTSLKAEKDKIEEKNVELVEQIARQKHSHNLIENQLECVHKVVQEVEDKNAELTDNVATLTANNEALVEQIKEQKLSHDFIENQLDSVRKEVNAAEHDQIKAAEKAADLENRIKNLHEEVKLANEAKQKASNAADATKAELMEATRRLDDMLVRVQVLKAEYEERESSLQSTTDSQMKSMNEVVLSLQRQVKAIESEKDVNETMYKNDISLQQEVSAFIFFITAQLLLLPQIYYYLYYRRFRSYNPII
jgi:chromosome segregation ATPase